jgi:hypothetical protein
MKSIKAKYGGFILSVFLITLFAAGSLYAENSVITGQNKEELDVKAVQEAVDKGGSVLLKGTFNFGPKGRVNIKKDIEIIGESDSNGKPLTRILGGFWTFHSPLPSVDLPLPGPGPKVTIKNIHFDGATWTPMHFPYISGAEISGNRITNVQPFGIPVKWSGEGYLLVNAGVIIGTRIAHREKILPGAVTGNLVVNNNAINLRCKDPQITMGQGVLFNWSWGATIEIKDNIIRNASRNSIEILDNYLDDNGTGSVFVAENNIVTPTVGIPFPTPETPNGIVVGWFYDMDGGADPKRNSKITVIKNFVQINGKTSAGIASLGDGVAILGNRVDVKGGPESSGISQLGSDAFIARNKIEGSGAFALGAIQWKELKANRNTFAWNDIKEFMATKADFLCYGNDNTLIGTGNKVENEGSRNTILTNID